MKLKFNLVKIIIFFLLIFNAFGTMEAQSIIKGIVKDAKTGEAVIGATVLIKGTDVYKRQGRESNYIQYYFSWQFYTAPRGDKQR